MYVLSLIRLTPVRREIPSSNPIDPESSHLISIYAGNGDGRKSDLIMSPANKWGIAQYPILRMLLPLIREPAYGLHCLRGVWESFLIRTLVSYKSFIEYGLSICGVAKAIPIEDPVFGQS